MYHCFDPVFVYGIKEKDGDNMIIDHEILEEYEIEYFTDCIVRDYACNIIYGVVISFDDFVAKKTFEKIVEFAKKFNLPAPDHYFAISGDFGLCHESYIPEQ
jgi:hypothetical protein